MLFGDPQSLVPGSEGSTDPDRRRMGGTPGQLSTPLVLVQKMTVKDVPEAFLSTFERTAATAGWAQSQWASMLVPCLIGSAQQVVDTLPASDLNDYTKVQAAIL